MTSLFEYYLVDWLGMGLSLISVYLLGNRNKWGFLLFALSNVIFIFLGLTWMNSVGMAVGNVAFMLINIRGYLHWDKNNREPSASSA
ncbi:hypothetical protein Mag101_01910 [Microbulbifer agarilyticus]|uniref:Uncharacterized protein n=1 Tax=Microbulbifer agarilyticus TaxID=260552 RepID=A0A1Q2M1I9_9GAMM|nr:nicotinamide mononucleotide transporter [Microbulbifer agarilyticus]AQQ66536.1 hypothetical protein Mag101_01910 [Microbulbifer agarilyticus]